ncbi:MAG: hypothetical protein IPG45_00105 [Deltaproteobacteria bacterium]|nr:hypothetical protein [Deltaproteobacteria bacterium]
MGGSRAALVARCSTARAASSSSSRASSSSARAPSRSRKQLATELAWRARHLKALAVEELEKEIAAGNDKGPLKKLFDTFNAALATLTVEKFADAYAQTITYGMLAARWISSDDENKPLFTRFGLPLGLADTTTWAAFAKAKKLTVPEGVDPKAPFVQVLDPALGTGTFLLRVIEVIHETMQAEFKMQGLDDEAARKAWVSYVRKDLLPRINGFELMMAPYIVSHLRLGLALQETGFTFTKNDRLRVFLTNTLEPRIPRQLDFLGTSVAEEANLAAAVKSDLASTVLVGNPPYAIQSANLTAEARALIEPFKFINGERIQEKGALQLERNLNDDYVKFWSYVINALQRSTCGIASMITNRAYSGQPHFSRDALGDARRCKPDRACRSCTVTSSVRNSLHRASPMTTCSTSCRASQITSLTRMPEQPSGPLAGEARMCGEVDRRSCHSSRQFPQQWCRIRSGRFRVHLRRPTATLSTRSTATSSRSIVP